MGAAVLACMDAPPVLELAEHVLDPVPLPVERTAMWHLDFPVGFLWDAGFDHPIWKSISQRVSVLVS